MSQILPKNKFYFLVLILLSLSTASCSSIEPIPPDGYAVCPVCKSNGDLACLYVKVDENTPTVEKDGVVYHFCSEECKLNFLKKYSQDHEKNRV